MDFTQWSSLSGMFGPKQSWVPLEEQDRLASYTKYDQLYWNDPTQFRLRVLDGEYPLYIPNARTIVDTTSHYILKGLALKVPNGESTGAKLKRALNDFLDRELFYSRFHTAKHAGVARGDFIFHLTADPAKAPGRRISLTTLDPSAVFPIYDEESDEPDKMIGCHIAWEYTLPEEPDRSRVRRLTYRLEEIDGARRVSREEGIFELEPKWYGKSPKLVKSILPKGLLAPEITTIPVYWFKNLNWDGQRYGSSELRGFESILRSVSQGSTDVTASLALEGLGVYATDGGRPVTDDGKESNWEVSPGSVMEVPTGSYFRRVEGVGSITPATDQINYLESKLREASSLSDVALGRVDVQTAQSGIALAIKFMPTLAKVEERDKEGLGKLKQLFFDWKTWHAVFEFEVLEGEIIPEIGEKLPQNRTERINELNNMLDRKVIPRSVYRDEMSKLGYIFPDNIEDLIEEEAKKDAERSALAAPEGLKDNAVAAANGELPPPANGGVAEKVNKSNNKNRTNESAGTESGQPLSRQARGGTPQ